LPGSELSREGYSLAEITAKTYRRREQYDQRMSKTDVYHYLDVTIPSRGKPLSIPLADPDETTLKALEEFAPDAMARYRISLNTPPPRLRYRAEIHSL
jgi:hypothetical protein